MQNLVWSEKEILLGWVEDNCRHLDLIASWDELVFIYEQMKFLDEINDSIRLSEFKEIVQEVNKFLTRMRTGLNTCTDLEGAIEFLKKHVDVKDVSSIKTRSQLAAHRSKQQWVIQAIKILYSTKEQLMDLEREEDEDAE